MLESVDRIDEKNDEVLILGALKPPEKTAEVKACNDWGAPPPVLSCSLLAVVVAVEEGSLSVFGGESLVVEVACADSGVSTVSAEVVSTAAEGVSLFSVVVDAIWLFTLMQDLNAEGRCKG